jgi:formamidopyrimidine-DNA glycosylase
MPELPEVETIIRALRDGGRDGPPLPGRTIARAEVLWGRTLAAPDL